MRIRTIVKIPLFRIGGAKRPLPHEFTPPPGADGGLDAAAKPPLDLATRREFFDALRRKPESPNGTVPRDAATQSEENNTP